MSKFTMVEVTDTDESKAVLNELGLLGAVVRVDREESTLKVITKFADDVHDTLVGSGHLVDIYPDE